MMPKDSQPDNKQAFAEEAQRLNAATKPKPVPDDLRKVEELEKLDI